MDNPKAVLTTIAAILAGMAILSLLEAAIPLKARGRWNRGHLGPNLTLTLITLATNTLLSTALVLALVWCEAIGFGLLQWFEPGPLASIVVVALVLDLAFYVSHVAMHKIPALWRFHRVHHSDPAVDVTTALRQHPGEGVIRYAFLAAFAIPLGAPPAAFAVYRTMVALSALLEHANVRLPGRLDDVLSLVFTWPNMHKVHHSRDARFTDTNYGNLVSWWDRLFATFTPAPMGANVAYGLDGFEDPSAQSTRALLTVPFQRSDTPWLQESSA
jgi:sterol desaturase/sphingolipid hydroxylase (fatty acid hydroxylase superfamily)